MYKVILTALQTFRSTVDHKTVHYKGDTVETVDVKRVNNLVSRGLAERTSIEEVGGSESENNGGTSSGAANVPGSKSDKVSFEGAEYAPQTFKEALIAIGVPCAPNAGVKGLTKKAEELTEEQKAALKTELTKE